MNILNTATRYFMGTFLLLIWSGIADADSLNAQLNSSRISLDDTVSLTLTLDSKNASQAPDVTPLTKDFEIVNTGINSSTQIVNGVRSESVSWNLTLAPKSTGQLTIPALSTGNATSSSLTLEVVDAGTLPNDPGLANVLNIEVIVDDQSHYVHEEIPLTVRITDKLGLRDIQLLTPTGANFSLTQTGTDKLFQDTSGSGSRTLERSFLLKSTASGELNVPAFQVQGIRPVAASTSGSSRGRSASSIFSHSPFASSLFGPSIFDNFMQQGEPVRVRSEPIVIVVKANPLTSGEWFLPAKQLVLDATWAPEHPTFSIGAATTRTIRLLALGASKEQLPELELPEVDGAKLYLNRSRDQSQETSEGTAAVREFQISVVPTRSGDIVLPEINIQWWNTVSDQQQTATLPEETIVVSPVAAASESQATSSSTKTGTEPGNGSKWLSTESSDVKTGNPDSTEAASSNDNLFSNSLLATLGILAAGLATLLILYSRHRAKRSSKYANDEVGSRFEQNKTSNNSLKSLEQKIRKYAILNDAHQTQTAFLAWCLRVDPAFNRDSKLLAEFSQGLSSAINELEVNLYADEQEDSWSGQDFLAHFTRTKESIKKGHKHESSVQPLPRLYPA